jgi:hypothetical protein
LVLQPKSVSLPVSRMNEKRVIDAHAAIVRMAKLLTLLHMNLDKLPTALYHYHWTMALAELKEPDGGVMRLQK